MRQTVVSWPTSVSAPGWVAQVSTLPLAPRPRRKTDLVGTPHGPKRLYRQTSVPKYKLLTRCDKYGRHNVQLFDNVVPIYS